MVTRRWTNSAFCVSFVAEQEGNGQEKEVSRDGIFCGSVGSRYLQELALSEEVEKKGKQSHFAGRNCSTAL